jgi:nucleotide-binding universal stress UspA family protein
MRIMLTYDGSQGADAAVATAAHLLAPQNPDTIVMTVWEPLVVEAIHAASLGGARELLIPNGSAEVDQHAEAQAQRLAEFGVRLAAQAGLDATPKAIADERSVAEAIVAAADELDVDLIVLGARGLTGVRAFVGSVSNHVLQHAHRPVLVTPNLLGDARSGPQSAPESRSAVVSE